MKKIIVSVLMCCVAAVQANNVAYVNMEKVFTDYYKTKDAESALKKQRDNVQRIGEEYRAELEDLVKQGKSLHESTQNIMITKEQRDKAIEKLNLLKNKVESKKQELIQFGQAKGKEIKKRYEASRDEITEELILSVAKISKRLKYDIVFDISGKTLNGIPAVVYYDKTKEITKKVITFLNAGHEKAVEKKAVNKTEK
ncbi:MAG: OmpH family outer membrane protein [Lentisphaeria bacterium]|nr:OmpH family outer membrane protein [Lentisphaeria bacterium]